MDNDRFKEKCFEKLTWKTKELAEAAIMYAKWQHGENEVLAHVYRCNYCKNWHISTEFQ